MTKSTSTKRFLAIILTIACTLTLCQSFSTKVSAAGGTNGWGMVKSNSTVYNSSGSKIGTIYANEGVTILSVSGSRYKVEYSTSSKPKQGYVDESCFRYIYTHTTCSARVKTACNTFYAASTNLKAGSLSVGETVAVLCSNGVYDYVEYNTTSGRKRAYVEKKYLDYSFNGLQPLYQENPKYPHFSYTVPSKKTVYGGPSQEYVTIGSVSSGEKVTGILRFEVSGYTMLYIKYTASGKNKYGYIRIN